MARDCLQKSEEKLITSRYFYEMSENLEKLLTQVQLKEHFYESLQTVPTFCCMSKLFHFTVLNRKHFSWFSKSKSNSDMLKKLYENDRKYFYEKTTETPYTGTIILKGTVNVLQTFPLLLQSILKILHFM